MSTVAIIGAGEIGGACAHALAAGDRVRRIILVDDAAAAGKALDIQQSGPVQQFGTALEGTSDLTAAIAADVCIVADRMSHGSEEWSGEAGLGLLRRLAPLASRAVLVCAGPGAGRLMEQAVVELGVPRTRLLGSAPTAFAAAAAAVIAPEAGCSAAEVSVLAVGAAGRLTLPWSQAAIAGSPAADVLSAAALARVEARISRLWPPGPGTLGVAAARMAEAILQQGRRTLSAFVVLDGELGVRRRSAALPVRVGPTGLGEVRVPKLDARERTALDSALGS